MIEVPLTRGYVALIDDEDAAMVLRYKWHANVMLNRHGKVDRVYARTMRKDGSQRIIQMHRMIMGEPDALVDHKEAGNTLDNRRSNLRVASHLQNQANKRKGVQPTSSRFKGATWNKKEKRWHARIQHPKFIHLGTFKTEENAAQAYNFAAEETFGEFALYNIAERATSPAED